MFVPHRASAYATAGGVRRTAAKRQGGATVAWRL